MVCIAAFIILCLVGIFVAFLSLFRRDIGRKYWAVFRKAWGCVGKKVRLQKCETNFKDDVKNTLLSKVVLRRPKWVKPLSAAIEVGSVLIVVITVWSLVESAKAGLALLTFGTCNVSQPESCALGAEVCGIDKAAPANPLEWTGRWFSEWGEIFVNLPDRFHSWNAEDYLVEPMTYVRLGDPTDVDVMVVRPLALDVFDPGCVVCMQSYRNQKSSGFFDRYKVALMLYPIELPDGGYKFANSDLIARYFYATSLSAANAADSPNSANPTDSANPADASTASRVVSAGNYGARIIDRLFTESNADGINYQAIFASASRETAEKILQSWLKDFGASKAEIDEIAKVAHGDGVAKIIIQVKSMVENQIHVKGIPTLIYDGKKHNGLYR